VRRLFWYKLEANYIIIKPAYQNYYFLTNVRDSLASDTMSRRENIKRQCIFHLYYSLAADNSMVKVTISHIFTECRTCHNIRNKPKPARITI